VEQCPAGDICYKGRCTTAECQRAEMSYSYFGCEWYPVDTEIDFGSNDAPFVIAVGNPSATATVHVEVQARNAGGSFDTLATRAVAPNGGEFITVPRDTHVDGSAIGLGLRVRSDWPAVAYQINTAEMTTTDSSSSTMLLPRHALGTRYSAVTTIGLDIPTLGMIKPGRSMVAISATEDGTRVSVDVTQSLFIGPGSTVPQTPAGGRVTVMLDEGQFLQLESNDAARELTGSRIIANKLVSVIAGATIGQPGAGSYNGDKLEEQLHPVETWSTKFVMADLSFPQSVGDQKNQSVYWTVLAAEDGTNVELSPAAGVTFDGPSTFSLNAGQWRRFASNLPSPAGYADFMLMSNKPVEVMHAFGKSPSSAMVVPVDQYLQRYVFLTHPYFTDTLTVTRQAGTAVTLDGTALADAMFRPVAAGYEAARIPMPACSGNGCAHSLAGMATGIAVVGRYDVCGGYAYVAGMAFKCLHPETNPDSTGLGTCSRVPMPY